MTTRNWLRLTAAMLGFMFGAAVVTAGQTEKIERELQLQLLQLQKTQPKVVPYPPVRSAPVARAAPPGSIARLGNSRLRHAAKPQCVTFSPDSKRVYSGGDDGMLRIWEVATGEALNSFQSKDSAINRARFTSDGTLLAAQFGDSQVHFLNPETLKETGSFPAQIGSEFALSSDGQMIAHIAPNGLLRVTELRRNLEKLEVPLGSPFQFHPRNKLIAVADPKGVVTLFMLAGGKPVITIENGGKVTGLAFSPDGKRVACGVGTVAKIWDISDGKTATPAEEIKDTGRVGIWLNNDRITVGNAESAGVYDLKAKMWVGRAEGISGDWAISPDGTKLAATGAGGLRIRLWDLISGKQLHAENDTFPDTALLAPNPDGKSVFLLAGDHAFLWPIDKTTATPFGKLPGNAIVAAIGKERLAVATQEGVSVYDGFDPTKPLPARPSRTITENAVGCRSVAVSPDGKKMAFSGDAARIVIADAVTGKAVRTLPTQTIALSLAFDPTGETLAVIGRDGFLRLAHAGEGNEADLWKVRVQRGQHGTVAFSADGKLIAASSSGLIKVVNASDGTEVFTVGGLFDNGLIEQLEFSPDGRHLLVASEGMTGGIRIWELATQSLVRHFSTGFGTVYRLGLFPDGKRLVSAGAEEAITLWDLTGRHGKDVPKADELLAAWQNLGSLEGATGYPATQTLIAAKARGVETVATGLEELLQTQKNVNRWVKELGSEDFDERELATKELIALGIRALPAVQVAAAKSESPEGRKRANEIVAKLTAKGLRIPESGLAGDPLTLYRAVEVLEAVATPDARKLLKRIAEVGGTSGEAAKGALARLAKQ